VVGVFCTEASAEGYGNQPDTNSIVVMKLKLIDLLYLQVAVKKK
jgi:hypothetical protein